MKNFGEIKSLLKNSLLLAVVSVQLVGCQTFKDKVVYAPAGDIMQSLAKEHTVPYMLGTEDVAVSCAMSEALSPLLMAFGRVTSNPDQLGVMLGLSAGACEEQRAWDNELRYLRAMRDLRPDEAEDALITQKRHLVSASKRQFTAYNHLVSYYGEPGGECPDLDDDFDQFIWMAGMLSGLQALNNELQSTSSIGVPKNIASKVERGTSCIDDDQWWGVPMAMKAAVWAMLPGALPHGENAWERLETAQAKGEAARVRLPNVLYAMAAFTNGKDELVKDIIRRHADQVKRHPANPDYALIDTTATIQLQALSDRLWTENTGHRTPMGGLGTFWDDKKESNVEVMDLDDLL
ncbi:hypothetical protein [Alkalimarinus alittae]|uniref:Uncharacterized protein n=1 Tax=Alkalimarinus alittae TaxID=2961619 RepID=A0ABY6N3D3_9ALTE|nr:hypothetical protein [Alkalimarinus alittae]UZE96549.1 hypothetical protein NKI27_02015 [Alkalimarinus alittae]